MHATAAAARNELEVHFVVGTIHNKNNKTPFRKGKKWSSFSRSLGHSSLLGRMILYFKIECFLGVFCLFLVGKIQSKNDSKFEPSKLWQTIRIFWTILFFLLLACFYALSKRNSISSSTVFYSTNTDTETESERERAKTKRMSFEFPLTRFGQVRHPPGAPSRPEL